MLIDKIFTILVTIVGIIALFGGYLDASSIFICSGVIVNTIVSAAEYIVKNKS